VKLEQKCFRYRENCS